jgi:hypothetical protein
MLLIPDVLGYGINPATRGTNNSPLNCEKIFRVDHVNSLEVSVLVTVQIRNRSTDDLTADPEVRRIPKIVALKKNKKWLKNFRIEILKVNAI